MTDRELLEAAAKAAGMDIEWQPCEWAHNNETGCEWNPLTNSGDALRLAVKLELQLDLRHSFHTVRVYGAAEGRIDESGDPLAATRRAIVRAAAEIGRSKDE
jgi:hypothetical protein